MAAASTAVRVKNTFLDLDNDLPTRHRRSSSLPRDFFKSISTLTKEAVSSDTPTGPTLWSDEWSDVATECEEFVSISSGAETPPVHEFEPRAPRAKLRTGARAFTPGCILGIGEQEVRSLRNALVFTTGVLSVEVTVTRVPLALSPTTRVLVQVQAGADTAAILSFAQTALLAAFAQCGTSLLLGLQPFTEITENADGLGVSATFAKIALEEQSDVCWHTMQHGCCKDSRCSWRHPRASELMQFDLRCKSCPAMSAPQTAAMGWCCGAADQVALIPTLALELPRPVIRICAPDCASSCAPGTWSATLEEHDVKHHERVVGHANAPVIDSLGPNAIHSVDSAAKAAAVSARSSKAGMCGIPLMDVRSEEATARLNLSMSHGHAVAGELEAKCPAKAGSPSQLSSASNLTRTGCLHTKPIPNYHFVSQLTPQGWLFSK